MTMQIQLVELREPKELGAFARFLTNLALIIDQTDFLKHVLELRKCWELNDKFVDVSNLDKWLNDYHPNFKLTSYAADTLDNAHNRLEIDSLHNNINGYESYIRTKELVYLNLIDLEMDILFKRFSIPIAFKKIIPKSIVCGVIEEEDYATFENSNLPNEFRDWIYQDVDLDQKITGYKVKDTKPEFFRDRKWYELSLIGKYPSQIAKEDIDRGSIGLETYRKRVKDQIDRYKEFLKRGASFRT